MREFVINNGILVKYYGNDSHVVIPDGVTKIGMWAFNECDVITSIEIPNSVTSIDDYAFRGCTNLTSINIPNSVTSIGHYAFYGRKQLKCIEIPNSVKTIGSHAFAKLPKIKPQYKPNGALCAFKVFNSDWSCHEFQYAVGKSYHQEGVIECCANGFHAYTNPLSVFNDDYYWGVVSDLHFAEVELNGDLDWVEDKFAASDIKIVRELTVSELAEIYNSMINANMKDFEIKDGVLEKYKGNKSHVVFPYSVRIIGTSAFNNCLNISSIEIPGSITNIAEMAFPHCPNLTSIKVSSSNSTFDSRNNCNAIIETAYNTLIVGCQNTVIPNSVTCIGEKAFAHCPNLTSIKIPKSVTSIGNSAFFDCPSLTRIVIPNSVKSINGVAFAHCISLSNIKIPNSVSYIGFNAFDDIKKVKPQYNANNTLRAFMAFFSDWSWCYSQYALGKSYHKDGKIVCNWDSGHGFLACTNPLDVFNYYNGQTDRYNFAEVELSGEMDWSKDMVAASDIKIVRKLTVSELAEIYNSMEKA